MYDGVLGFETRRTVGFYVNVSIYLSIYIYIIYIYIVVFFYIWVYKPTYHKQRGSTEKQKHRSREGNTKSKQ